MEIENTKPADTGSTNAAHAAEPNNAPSAPKPRKRTNTGVVIKITTQLEAPKVLKSFREETTKMIAAAHGLYKCMRIAAVAGEAEEVKRRFVEVIALLDRLREAHRYLNRLIRRTRLAKVLDWVELVKLCERARRANREIAATGKTDIILDAQMWKALLMLCLFLLRVDEAPALHETATINRGNRS